MVELLGRRDLLRQAAGEILSRSGDLFARYFSWISGDGEKRGESPVDFRSDFRPWRDHLVEVARILGVREGREPEEIVRLLAVRMEVEARDRDKEELVRAIARKLGLKTDEVSYIDLLESIGERLGLGREHVTDWNKYAEMAEPRWITRIAEKLGVSRVRSDDEVLWAVAQRVGAEVDGAVDRRAVLQAIARKLGVPTETEDHLELLHLIESRVRLVSP
jgi:hypothetical protein